MSLICSRERTVVQLVMVGPFHSRERCMSGCWLAERLLGRLPVHVEQLLYWQMVWEVADYATLASCSSQ